MGRSRAPGTPLRGRPPRLAHRVAASPASLRRERALAARLEPVPPMPADAPAHVPAHVPAASGSEILCLPQPEWLPHLLSVAGPAADLAAFGDAARGPGHIAWSTDGERDREAWTAQLLALSVRRPDLSAQSARGLAYDMSERVAALDLAAADRLLDRRCPLDLNALVPLPAPLLRLGPEDPAVVAWLWQHWGTTWMLRGVEAEPPGRAAILLPPGQAAMSLRFWSADWTPWRALAAVRARWPRLDLRLTLLPVAE